MSSDTRMEVLIAQCRSNDVDVKVDALTKIHAEVESGVEINDPDAFISVVKTCIRSSNQHLTNAALNLLPVLIPLLVSPPLPQLHATNPSSPTVSTSTSSISPSAHTDVVTLRHLLTSLLPSGGIIDRLGDKERAQVKARESLVLLGAYAFRSAPNTHVGSKSKDAKGPETPISIFERCLKEGGLASKVWKVREQSILTLVQIRRDHHLFPIRPYLSLLVDCLEDTDAHVRDCSRQSVVELFSGPGVTDAARADLKKEMARKGVRKTIVDGVLSKLLGTGAFASNPQSREGSENGDPSNSKPKEYVPPSLALQGKRPRVTSQSTGIPRSTSYASVKEIPRPASRSAMVTPPPPPTVENTEVHPVYIASARDLENEFAAMAKPFEGKETEHNWATRERAILRVRGMLKGDVHVRYSEAFFASLKDGFIQWSLKTLSSLRTTVATNTCSLYLEMAVTLKTQLDPFCEVLLTNLLKMAGFTKKITAQQSQATVTAIITHTSAQPRTILSLLWTTLQEKTIQARAFVIAHLKHYIEVHGQRAKHAIESTSGLEILEKSLRKALADSNPAVRENARALFWVFEDVWKDRGMVILESLETVARKQLEKACPNPEISTALPPATPHAAKKSSVAAAIAASRAKAKAIATAPPTLRHQATSGSHTVPIRPPGSPGTSPRSSLVRPASPLRASTSPPSPSRGRVLSTIARTASATAVSARHSRTPSGDSTRATSPSLSDVSGSRQRASSPLTSTAPSSALSSSLRKAVVTALPASPPGQISPTPRGKGPVVSLLDGPMLPNRGSSLFPQFADQTEDSLLLLAQTIPVPEDDETGSEDDRSINLMSFSTPFQMYPPGTPVQKSQHPPLSPGSDDSKPTTAALSSGSVDDMGSGSLVIEDALRARAEQAESAAERLLELVEPEDEGIQHHPVLLASLLSGSRNGHATPKPKVRPPPLPASASVAPPCTPVNRNAAILRKAAMFQDSPASNGRSPSLLKDLQPHQGDSVWTAKRRKVMAEAAAGHQPIEVGSEPEDFIKLVEQGNPDVSVLQKILVFCRQNEVVDNPGNGESSVSSPFVDSHLQPSKVAAMWAKNGNFDLLFKVLVQYLLNPVRKDGVDGNLECALMIISEMLDRQAPLLEGKESDLFDMLLRVRYAGKPDVLEATIAIRDALTSKLEPVYGLTTMHASLRAFRVETPPGHSDISSKSGTYAFGLIALGKFILRLPAEIAEEELPRLKGTLTTSLNDKSSLLVREAAAASIIAAQLVLRDETHLFALLDGLADDKKNLLTYLFDKHGVRGLSETSSTSGMDKLEKEIRRLDIRMSTPSKSPPL